MGAAGKRPSWKAFSMRFSLIYLSQGVMRTHIKKTAPTEKNKIESGRNNNALVLYISVISGSAATEYEALWNAHNKKYAPTKENIDSNAHRTIKRNFVLEILRI
jgi:hypothetical protein